MIKTLFAGLLGGIMIASLLGIDGSRADANMSAHSFEFTSIEGGPLPLTQFRGKVLLVVNTASECGFTHQYADLQTLWAEYRDRGVVVLGVPSNDFGGQEPGKAQEIKEFCEVNFSVDFPMTDKVQVKGDNAHPFYLWAAGHAGVVGKPRWNFHKYLIGADGRFVDWFATTTKPTDAKVKAAIETLLVKAGERS